MVQSAMVRRIECFTGSMLRPGIFLRGKLDKLALLHQHIDHVMEAPLGASLPPPSLIGGFEPLQGRTRYRKAEAAFDPLAFLSPFSGAALEEPRLLELDAVPEWARPAPDVVPATTGSKQTGKATVMLSFFEEWDRADHLLLVDARKVPLHNRGTWFRVYKDENVDRPVFNRVRRNAREVAIQGLSIDAFRPRSG